MTEDSRTISRLRRMIHKVLIVAFALTAMHTRDMYLMKILEHY